MGGRGRGKRGPSKAFEETYRGKRALKKQLMDEKRAAKASEKADKKQLWENDLCRDPEGNITTFQEVGRRYGPQGGASGHKGAASGHLGAESGHLGGEFGHHGGQYGGVATGMLGATYMVL